MSEQPKNSVLAELSKIGEANSIADLKEKKEALLKMWKKTSPATFPEELNKAEEYVDSLILTCENDPKNIDERIHELKRLSEDYSVLKDVIVVKILDAIAETVKRESFITNEYYMALDKVWRGYTSTN